MSKYGVFSGPYFPEFSPNTGKYGPEKAPYLDTFHAVDYFISKNLTLLKKNLTSTFFFDFLTFFDFLLSIRYFLSNLLWAIL